MKDKKRIRQDSMNESELKTYLVNRILISWFTVAVAWIREYRSIIEQLTTIYPLFNLDGFDFRQYVDTDGVKIQCRCFPRLPDLLSPFRRIDKSKVKVVMVWGEPMNNGASTSIPFAYNAQLYKASDFSKGVVIGMHFHPAIHFIEYWLMSVRHTIVTPTQKGSNIITSFNAYDWMDQGVLLLHAYWTVEEQKPGSHTNIWNSFVPLVLKSIQESNGEIIFVLMGPEAQVVGKGLDNTGYVLKIDDPALFLDHNKDTDRDYINIDNPFIITNKLLTSLGKSIISW